MTVKKLVLGNDHTALEMKREIMAHLAQRGIETVDVGTNDAASFPYPVSAFKAAQMVAQGQADGGILICGTGVGMSLAANKVHSIRACVCSEPYSAALAKRHNNANILCFGARVIGPEMAKMIVDAWLDAEFEGGRHQTRVEMIGEIEETRQLKAAQET